MISFNSITNIEYNNQDSIINLDADLNDAVLNGIRFPSTKQCKGGKFSFNFKISRKSNSKEKLFYRLYYQNESYKFDETHLNNGENFYGSWEDFSTNFKPIPEFDSIISINDSIVIIGNPRNEAVYFGPNRSNTLPDSQQVKNTVLEIKNNKEWFNEIEKKANKESKNVEEEVKRTAVWYLNEKLLTDKSHNNRMWRNPRMGKYEFILVVISESQLLKTPYYIKNIHLPDINGKFINPITYFRTGKGSQLNDIICLLGNKKIKIKATFNLGSGIYVDNKQLGRENFNKENYSNQCGDSYLMYRKAHFQQYFHWINRDFPLKNIPENIDVMDPSFTRQEYESLKKQYEKTNKFVDTYVNSSDCPCKTVKSDSTTNSITIINPGNKDGEHKKEHVGIVGRIGFTYGKWRAKIKFPELINKHNVWNGLTNAFWLLAQETNSAWNQRRECNAKIAYIPKSAPDDTTALKMSRKKDGYSEIDFEILKESQFWPATSYPGKKNGPTEDAAANNDIIVSCTNWDLACHAIPKFNVGATKNIIEEMEFTHHRWDHWYKALTSKIPINHKEIFGGEFYYFEIDWQPTKIIWRIGPSKDKMQIICIMDETITSIPNNQMVALVTQEWHNQEWWPMAPFKQNFVPFPKKDIIGKILEIEVE